MPTETFTLIVRDTAGITWRVAEAGYDHAWTGRRVKASSAGYVDVAKARTVLVRKIGCTVLAREAV